MPRLKLVLLFVIGTLAIGTAIGLAGMPGAWYRGLAKPAFNPPDWIFGPVWSVLYILIGIAGARSWARGPGNTATRLWFVQIILNFAWNPVFFVLHQIGIALVIVLAMLVVILAFIGVTWRSDRLSALLFVPYAAWVAFASVLNATIWSLN